MGEGTDAVRERVMKADEHMKPGSVSMGRALANIVCAVELLADEIDRLDAVAESDGRTDA